MKLIFFLVSAAVGIFVAFVIGSALISPPTDSLFSQSPSGHIPRYVGTMALLPVFVVAYVAFIKSLYKKLFKNGK